MRTYVVDPERSTLLVSARSTMGPIVFEGRDLAGEITATVDGSTVRSVPAPAAAVRFDLRSLRSGNELYDAELRRRLHVDHHQTCTVRLTHADDLGGGRFSVAGDVSLQGNVRQLRGTIEAAVPAPDAISVVGEQAIDIRDFKIPTPQMLLMRIYPEVRVQVFLQARYKEHEHTS